MAISPSAGATASGASQVSSSTITIPTGILGGDVVLIFATVVPISATVATITASSTGTTPVQAGSTTSGSEPLPATVSGAVFWFVAAGAAGSASTDVGKIVTLTYSTTGFPATALQGYSGASTSSPVDVIQGAFGGANTASVTCPTLTTGVSGDWAVFLGGGAAEGGNLTIPAGSTSRQAVISGSDVAAAITDSAGAVGSAGASIGGGTFTTSTATNSVLVAFTVGLTAAGAGGTAASAGMLPVPDPRVMTVLLDQAWTRADWQAQGVADLSVSFASTASGVDTWNVLSPWNGGATQPMRVLAPTTPNAGYPHAFLVMLPVDPAQDTTFGDSIGTVQGLNAHNAYNLTCVQPGYAAVGGQGPWFADNPLDPTISYEKFTLLIAAWIRANLAITGNEAVYLIGFSRSGIGGQGLQFRHPDIFAATASWDAPFMMADYDGTDPTNGGSIGGSPALFYGTSSSFMTKYQLSAANLANWAATGQWAVNRLWLGLGPAFPADTPAYDAALTAAGIPHTYTFANTSESHAWHSDWVAAALAAIIPSSQSQATTVLPQQIPHPLLADLLDLASLRLYPGIDAAATVQGTASLAGAGSVQALAVQSAPASPAGAGTVAALVTQQAPSSPAGAGTLAALAVQQATAAAIGAGSVAATSGSSGSGTASLAGAGSVSALAVIIATAAAAGAGSVTPLVAQSATATAIGAGTLAATVTQPAAATAAGAGAVTASAATAGPFTVGILTASTYAPSGSTATSSGVNTSTTSP